MANQNSVAANEIKTMKKQGISDATIDRVVRERRDMVESEIYRFNGSLRKIEALKQYIDTETEKMCSIGSPVLSDMPKGPHNPQAGENRLINSIDKIIAWERDINMEKGKNSRFEEAFNSLSDVGKILLKFTYSIYGEQMLSPSEIVEKIGFSASHTRLLRRNAMDLLAFRLFGPVSATHPDIYNESEKANKT